MRQNRCYCWNEIDIEFGSKVHNIFVIVICILDLELCIYRGVDCIMIMAQFFIILEEIGPDLLLLLQVIYFYKMAEEGVQI
jgi:hypothetical protein